MLVPDIVFAAKFCDCVTVRAVEGEGTPQYGICVEIILPLLSVPGAAALRISSPGKTRSGLMRPSSNVVPRLENEATL
jgi:hypothetical protein